MRCCVCWAAMLFSAAGKVVPFVSAKRRLALQKRALMIMSADRVDSVMPPARSIHRWRGCMDGRWFLRWSMRWEMMT